MKIDRDKPLPDHTKLDYYECYAKVILEDLFADRYGVLDILDKPDLQNNEKDIGIEVTSADSPERREAVKLWYTMPYVSKEKQKSNKERMEQLGMEYQGGLQVWPTVSYSDSEIEGYPIEYFLKAVNKKIKKLNGEGYKSFTSYDLFVYSEIYVSKSLLLQVKEKLKVMNAADKKFTKIYLCAQEKFISFDMQVGTFNIDYIDDNQYGYAIKAREMVIWGEENS